MMGSHVFLSVFVHKKNEISSAAVSSSLFLIELQQPNLQVLPVLCEALTCLVLMW
jgi:hypothetical protein